MHNINLALFYFVNGGAGHYALLDLVLVFLTTYMAYGVLVMVGLYILFWVPSHAQEIQDRLRAIRHATEFVFVTLSIYVLVGLVKSLTIVSRPFVVLPGVTGLIPLQSGYSFPSMHAALAIGIATIVYLHQKRLGIFLYGFAIVVAISRVYVGVHYPKDVFVGGLLGFAFAGLLHIAFCNMHSDNVKDIAGKAKTG